MQQVPCECSTNFAIMKTQNNCNQPNAPEVWSDVATWAAKLSIHVCARELGAPCGFLPRYKAPIPGRTRVGGVDLKHTPLWRSNRFKHMFYPKGTDAQVDTVSEAIV